MKKIVMFLASLCLLASCSTEKKAESSTSTDSLSTNAVAANQSDEAKKWLIEAIETTFQGENYADTSRHIYTPTYEAYKNDAVGVGYDGGLSEEEFVKKWKGKFNTKLAGMGTGFLISGQDFGKIKVATCDLTESLKDTIVFKVVIDDLDAKAHYKRDIKVVPAGKSFLIADVLEYNEQ